VRLRQISIRIARTDAEQAEALLNLAGSLALTFDDAQDTPLFEPEPGSTPLWPRLAVHALFPPDFDVAALGALLQHALPSAANIETTFVDKADWQAGLEQEVFIQHVAPNLSIVPADWEGTDSAAHVVRLHMGLAFGTGRHPTTRLCLDWLAANPPRGLQICDFGCGSGVLAIAALQLGATHAVAIDTEPQAVAATLANASLNAVEERIAAGTASQFADLKVDLVLANILAGTLEGSVDAIAAMLRPRGCVVLSGILAEQTDALARCFARRFESLDTTQRDGWARITGILR
jgi:ribosomal protein L11 methyltransferase